MSEKNITATRLEKELRALLNQPDLDMQVETVKTLRTQVADRMGLPKFPSDQKDVFKNILERVIKEKEKNKKDQNNDDSDKGDDSNDEEDEDSDHEEGASKPRQQRSSNNKKNKKTTQSSGPSKKSSSSYSENVQKLLDLGNALRVGPTLYKGLKEMDDEEEQIETLTERLRSAGARWKGRFPTVRDVARAKAERQKKDDLDGLDPSLIINDEGRGSRRRSRAKAVNYAVDDDDEEEEEEEEAVEQKEESSDEEINEKPKKRAKTKQASTDDDDSDDDDDFEGVDDSEGEAEFDWTENSNQ